MVMSWQSWHWLGALWLLAGCVLLDNVPRPTPLPNVVVPSVTPPPTEDAPLAAPALPFGWQDAREVMRGVCFEAAFALRDEVFVMRSLAELEAFWARVDALNACRRPIARPSVTFPDSAALVGLWSYGVGCTARHAVRAVTAGTGTLDVELALYIEGACNYELLRPFWVFIADAAAQAVTLRVLTD